LVSADDWITFKVSGSNGKTLVCRVKRVRRFDTFEEMLSECGVQACLPGVGSLEEGVKIYRAFGTMKGKTYAELEGVRGVIAMDVAPLRPSLP
tara:strand:- start:160 stop:438 length:279 start_codon:yes stop_codon:yes gene_type:complete